MKILCATDFSNASVNACRWATKFLQSIGEGSLELVHCINIVSRSQIFLNKDDVFLEYATKDLLALEKDLKEMCPDVEIKSFIVKEDPKSFLTRYLKDKDYDFLVTGTKGMTALKEMTVGSVTAYLMDRVDTPVLAIPEGWDFQPVQRIMAAMEEPDKDLMKASSLIRLVKVTGSELEVVHTSEQVGVPVNIETSRVVPLGGINYTLTAIHQGKSIPKTLTNYAVESKADIMVMLHRKRGFFERLFQNSFSREELFVIKTPLLILPEA